MTINLKNGLRATKISYFISRSTDKNSIYHLIHEFSDLEEIKESFSEIFSNVRKLRFISKFDSFRKKKFFVTINCTTKGKFLAKDVNVPIDLEVVNANQYLFNKFSNKILIKVLIGIDF